MLLVREAARLRFARVRCVPSFPGILAPCDPQLKREVPWIDVVKKAELVSNLYKHLVVSGVVQLSPNEGAEELLFGEEHLLGVAGQARKDQVLDVGFPAAPFRYPLIESETFAALSLACNVSLPMSTIPSASSIACISLPSKP